ncbi:hypothetical protein HDV01_000300 [Terramyces sp. JEL0728]|nr:hypothetical protein HDV01_000300 [Terramyces sp. JEL0728]
MGDDMQKIKETLDATVSEANGLRVLNQYTITKQLGSGSFGTVHLAYDAENDRKVAIKECSKSKLRKQKNQALGVFPGRGRGRGGGVGRRVTVSRPAQVAPAQNPIDLVRSEIAILKKLNHPNIVKLYEVLDDPKQDSLFMVFELCEKGAVMDVSMSKNVNPLDIKVARNYFQQLILGIEYCNSMLRLVHEHDIAHRDIKPDNMLISKDGVVKIVDFGVSEMFSKGNDKFKNTAGSPAFYAPETCNLSHGEISAMAADIWAMGVTLFCMVFGKLPFTGSSIIQLYDGIRDNAVVYPEGADPRLVNCLKKVLDKDPASRITLDELRVDPWVTDDGKAPLITMEENCSVTLLEITQNDIDAAVKPLANLFTVLKAVSKLKNIHINKKSQS